MSLFGGASERLAFVLDLDSKKAVDEAKKAGDSLEKELGRGDKSAGDFGGTLQKTGLGMMAFGGVAVAAFGKMAQAGEEAHQVDVKLADSVSHAGDKAGGSVKPFEDLASAMQKKVAFDDEAIKTSESMQIQMGLTQDQVLQLTPLVADLAAKEGVDLTTATDQVTKAINGKKKGLEAIIGPIDATAYATDRYAAVQDALSAKVGGFAEVQGKTFAGQLEILTNQLRDLEEGVGQGAVKAFSTMLGAVTSVTSGLDSLGAGTTSAIGEIGTWAAAGLIAVGAGTALVGTITQQIVKFKELAIVEAAASNPYVAMAAGIAAVAAITYEGTQNAEHFSVALKSAGDVAKLSGHDMEGFLEAAKLTGTSMYDVGTQIAKTSVPAAQAFADKLDGMGKSSVDVRRAITDQQRATAELTVEQQGAQAAQDELNDSEAAAVEVGHATTMTTQEIKQAQADLHDQLKTTTRAYAEQYDQQNKGRDLDIDVRNKIADLTDGIGQNGATLDINTQKGRDNIRALEDTGGAIAALVQQRYNETGSVTEANAAGDLYKINLAQQLTAAGLTEQQVQDYINTLNLTPVTKNTAITVDANQAFNQLHELDALIAGIDPSVDLQIRLGAGAHALGGDFTEATADVGEQGKERLVRRSSGVVSVLPSGSFASAASGGGGRTVLDNVIVIDGREIARQRRTFDRRH